ncbi:MAG: hypothetical protein KIT58_18835 [Planctomycetota bacterium]|nr:hypothetical protein [Planctomycetota bacterium]
MEKIKLREQWRSFKQAFDQHLGPVLGKRWATKAFSLGLGPKLDDLAKEYDATATAWSRGVSYVDKADQGDLGAMSEVYRLMGHVVKHAKAVAAHADKAQEKLKAYEDILRQALAGARSPLLPAQDEAVRKSFGSLATLGLLVKGIDQRSSDYYGRNAKAAQERYSRSMKMLGRAKT